VKKAERVHTAALPDFRPFPVCKTGSAGAHGGAAQSVGVHSQLSAGERRPQRRDCLHLVAVLFTSAEKLGSIAVKRQNADMVLQHGRDPELPSCFHKKAMCLEDVPIRQP